ncbi:transposase [Streptomyces sp. NPDC059534]|uniref:transposase n=1 Tax=Streptomyces sp. NPDC059534 TaxID=3346859 RepID=UPI00368EF07F
MRVPHEDKPGKRVQQVFSTVAASGAILELADHLICQGVTRVVMEATSTFFVPPKPIHELRDLTRARAVMTHERTRHKQRTAKPLEDAQIKLSTVIADIFGVSGRAILEALIAGERSPKALADLAHGTIKASHATLAESLTSRFEEHHAFMCRMLLDTVDYLTVQIDRLTARITLRLAELSTTEDDEGPGQATLMPITDTERLDEIPGVGPGTAQVILAEIGLDISVFPTAGHLVSWAKLSPRTIQSGGRNTSGPTGKGNP